MARRGRPTSDVVLTDEERDTLERWARRPKSSQALALRVGSYWPVRMRSAPTVTSLPS